MSDALTGIATLDLIQQREVAILGHDELAMAHALNLRDSGVDVRLGIASVGRARRRAEAEGFPVLSPADAAADAEVVVLPGSSGPDTRKLYDAAVSPSLRPGMAVVLGSGEAVRFHGLSVPPGVDAVMVLPVAPGDVVRTEFVDGRGVPALVAVVADASGLGWQLAASYATALGCARAGMVPTTCAAQAEAMAFGRAGVQARVGVLMEGGYRTLLDAGYPAELAYLAVVHETKAMVDALYVGGLAAHRRDRGGEEEPVELDEPSQAVLAHLTRLLAEIHAGQEAPAVGAPAAGLEAASTDLRRMMSWLRA